MKSLLISVIYTFARTLFKRLVDDQFFSRVEDMVVLLMMEDIPGSEKKERVYKAVWLEWKNVKQSAIDTVIQIVLLRAGYVE